MKNLDIAKLNELYRKGEEIDRELFAEQRTNILLCSGDHYARRNKAFFNRVRDNQSISLEQKIRLTKNHIQKIIKLYVNNIVSYAPGVIISPANPRELSDQKASEICNSVWRHAKTKLKFDKKIRELADDFFKLGECAVKVFWNPNKGDFIGYEQRVSESGVPEFDAYGNPVSSGVPVFSGDLDIERLFSFNLFRSESAQTWDESEFVGVRKLMDRKEAIELFGQDKESLIKNASGSSFIVFDGPEKGYKRSENQVLIREFYFRPGPRCENGYYYITTDAGILEQGELPFGIFPIVIETCEDAQTSPRGISPIRHARPYQVEINRAASKQAEHQVTLGDDKIILMNNSKITPGAQLPGVRTMNVIGQEPTILAGRTGEQYLNYINSQIEEMYRVMMVDEALSDRVDGQIDPFAMLYKNLRQKKAFSNYVSKFEGFVISVVELYIDLARHYFDETTIIPMIDKKEIVNIDEFKSLEKTSYKVKIEPLSDDIETIMGRQLTLTNFLQYAGGNLTREDVGKVLKNMPFANAEEIFSDITLDYESANNIILALDKGKFPEPKPSLNKEYLLKRLTARQLQSDYEFLPDEVKANYEEYIRLINMLYVQELEQIKAANADLIPAQGFAVPCDFYVPDPASPGKTKRARIPIDALSWLVQRLEQQGVYLDQLQNVQQAAQAGVAASANEEKVLTGAAAQGEVGQALAQQETPEQT